MAIVFEETRKPVNWVKLLFVVFSIAFTAFAIYFLFFAASPRIEVVLPKQLEETSAIKKLKDENRFVEPQNLLSDPVFRALRVYALPPSVGILHRDNPFQPL